MGTTSHLIKAAELCLHARDESSFLSVIESIQASHLSALDDALHNAVSHSQLDSVKLQIRSECSKLVQFLRAIRVGVSSLSNCHIYYLLMTCFLFRLLMKSHRDLGTLLLVPENIYPV